MGEPAGWESWFSGGQVRCETDECLTGKQNHKLLHFFFNHRKVIICNCASFYKIVVTSSTLINNNSQVKQVCSLENQVTQAG